MVHSTEQPIEGNTSSFIVRIWRESTDESGHIPAWRGSIEQVGTNKRLYFCDLKHALRFIEEEANIMGDQGASKWSDLLAWARHLLV